MIKIFKIHTMTTIFWSLFLLCFMAAGISHAKVERQTPMYSVDGVKVDIESTNAAKARDEAIEKAGIQAFRQLAERLLNQDELLALDDPSAAEVQNMLKGFQISKEKISPKRYQAEMAFGFNPNKVNAYLDGKGKSYTSVQSKPVLIVPFLRKDGRDILWDEGNIWREKWEDVKLASPVVPIALPVGDVEDLANIPNVETLSGSAEPLLKMTERYGAQKMVAVVLYMPDGQTSTQTRLFVMSYSGGQNDGVPVEISLPIQSVDQNELLSEAVKQTMTYLENDWKEKTAVDTSVNSTILAYVPFTQLPDWVKISGRLQSIRKIKEIEVEGLVQGRANIKVHFVGSLDGLRLALASEDLSLTSPETGFSNLSFQQGTIRYQIRDNRTW